jgi:hypothetical protein
MKFRCACGEVIADQTEFDQFKAHLIADRDWLDYLDLSQSDALEAATLERRCYQCDECGRLHLVQPDGSLRTFKPEHEPEPVLDSSRSEAWRAPLIGIWNDRLVAGGRKPGWLDCDAEGGAIQGFDDWPSLQTAYFAMFAKLRSLDRVRSALLRKNDVDIHVWPGRGE